jgi:hypothetical protein
MQKKEITFQWVVDKSRPAAYICCCLCNRKATEGGATNTNPRPDPKHEINMPQAIISHTRNLSPHTIAIDEDPGAPPSYDAALSEVCLAAAMSFHSMLAVYDAAADLDLDSSGRDAISRVVDCMQSGWRRDVERVAEIRATSPSGIVDKARLLEEILELHAGSPDEVTPAMILTASLVADVIRLPTHRSL